jgi:hypothetical protein
MNEGVIRNPKVVETVVGWCPKDCGLKEKGFGGWGAVRIDIRLGDIPSAPTFPYDMNLVGPTGF